MLYTIREPWGGRVEDPRSVVERVDGANDQESFATIVQVSNAKDLTKKWQ